jgi:TATA-box binding protein (TBP) (component of TFIID and TFIIIB)
MSSSVNLAGIVAGATVMTYDPSILCRDDTFRYIVSLDAIRKKHAELPSWVQITTITMTCKLLATGRIDLDLIREAFRKEGSIRIRRKGALCDGHTWTMKETTFYNQVTIGYVDQYSTKSIKVFPNGSFQVAGCSDLYDCQRVSKQLSFLLSSILKLPEPLPAEAFRVVMINTNFAMNRPVNLNTIIEKLSRERDRFEVSFNPDRYSAVKIKFKPRPDMKQVTASVFSTGKIIVTGAETLKEIAFAYDVLNTKLKDMTYDNQPFLNLLEEVQKNPDPSKYDELRDVCIDAASYYLKDDDDDLYSIEEGNIDALLEIGQRIAKEMTNRKKSMSSDTVLGAKFEAWVKTLKARGVASWL